MRVEWIQRILFSAVAILLVDVGLMLLCDVTLFEPGRLLDEIRWWPSLLWGRFVVHRLLLVSGLLLAVAWIRSPALRAPVFSLAKRVLVIAGSPFSTTHRELPFGIRLLASGGMMLALYFFGGSAFTRLRPMLQDFFRCEGRWGNISMTANPFLVAVDLLFVLASIAAASGLLARNAHAWRCLLALSTLTALGMLMAIPYLIQTDRLAYSTGTAGIQGGKSLLALAMVPVLIAASWTAIYLYRKRALYRGSAQTDKAS